jgi:serine/threonine protein kinase
MKVLTHKNLVRLVEIINDKTSKHLYLVLEYMEGGPIVYLEPRSNKYVYRLTGRMMGESTARYLLLLCITTNMYYYYCVLLTMDILS